MIVTKMVKKSAGAIAVMLAVQCMIICLTGLLIWKEILPLTAIPTITTATGFAVVLLIMGVIVKNTPTSKLPVSMITSFVYMILMQIIGRGIYHGDKTTITWPIVLPMVAALVAALWGSKKKTRRY